MVLYVTPEKYRTLGFGIDLEGIEDVELVSILSRASAIADGYCAVPRLPHPHSFLGGSITPDKPEQHFWRLPESDFDVGSRRVYPYHWPVKSMTQFRVKVTNTQYVTIGPTELFINNTERYVEVISLAFTGVGLFGAILPTIGLMRPIVEIAYVYGEDFDEVGETLYATDARTYRALHQHWVAGAKVYLNGAEKVLTTDYTLGLTEGTVVFNDALSAGDVVTADYTHLLPWELRDAVGMIATHLLGEREQQARGMAGVKSLKVAEITITNADDRVTSENLAYIEPEAAWLLDGFKFITVR
jgi:hypothetical protein